MNNTPEWDPEAAQYRDPVLQARYKTQRDLFRELVDEFPRLIRVAAEWAFWCGRYLTQYLGTFPGQDGTVFEALVEAFRMGLQPVAPLRGGNRMRNDEPPGLHLYGCSLSPDCPPPAALHRSLTAHQRNLEDIG